MSEKIARNEKIARDIARKFGIHVEWASANREYVVDTRPFGTAKEARKYARSLSRMLRNNPAKFHTRKKVRAKTRVAVRYKITAQNKGKRMHFDGRNFSERPTVKSFALASDAKQTALALIRRYPILRKYRVRVESFP